MDLLSPSPEATRTFASRLATVAEPVRPLDEDDTRRLAVVEKTAVEDLPRRGEAIEVDVEQR